jgi:7-keto-8-aminopelargonate synthetase-like enzyme
VKVAQELKLPLAGSAETPVQFVVIGKAENAVDVVKRLHQRGFYVNMSAYPIVPQGKGGLRITLTNHLSLNDLSNLAKAVREELDEQVKLVQSATR